MGEIEDAETKFWEGIRKSGFDPIKDLMEIEALSTEKIAGVVEAAGGVEAADLGGVFAGILAKSGVPNAASVRVQEVSAELFPAVPGFEWLQQLMFSFLTFGDFLKKFLGAFDPFVQRGLNSQFLPNWVDAPMWLQAARRSGVKDIVPVFPPEYGFDSAQAEFFDKASQLWIPEQSLMEGFRRGIVTPEVLDSTLQEMGYGQGSHRELLQQLTERLVEPEALMELMRRQSLEQGVARERLQQFGFSPESADSLIALAEPLLAVGTVLNANIRNIVDDAQAGTELAKHGFSSDAIDKLIRSSRVPMTPFSVVSAMWREHVKPDDATKMLMASGLTEADAETFKKTQEVVPSVQDLIRMSVREVFNPAIVKQFGQDLEFPKAMTPWAKKIGMTDEVSKLFWAAHWVLPSPGQGFDMMHRGIIDRAELATLLRALDVMPFWRDKMIQLSDRLIPRRTLPRMAKNGLIDKAALVERFVALGYSDADAVLLAEDALMQNASGARELTKGDILRAFEEGLVGEAFVKERLGKLRYSQTDIDFLLARATVKRDLLVRKATVEETEKEVEKAQDTTAKATLKLYREGMISDELATRTLTGYGVPVDVANFWLAREDTLRTIELLEAQASVVKAKLDVGQITKSQAVAQLAAQGFSVPGATEKVATWSAEAEARQIKTQWTDRLPTKTDITRWLKKGMIDGAEAVFWYRQLGFSDEVIVLFLEEFLEENGGE